MIVETRAVLSEDSSARLEHLLRLGGDRMITAAEILAVDDEERRVELLEALAGMLLRDEGVELVDFQRERSGEIVLRVRHDWDRVAFSGDLRVVTAPLGTEAALVAAVAPATQAGLRAMRDGAKRSLDAVLPRSRIEHRYILELPDGYRARQLPPPLKHASGGISLERRFVAVSPHRIEGSLLLEIDGSGPRTRRLAELHDALKPVDRSELEIEVELVAETLASTGRLAEAVAETRRLVAAHPSKPYYRSKHASVLLAAGLVDTARAEARRAAELAPDSAFAHQIVATTLETDSFGRAFAPPFDRAGALEARRRQLALEGPTSGAAFETARLLSFDADGIRLTPAAPFDEIVALTEDVEDFEEQAAALRAEALLRQGRGADAEEIIRAKLTARPYFGFRLAAIAQARGTDAAIAELPALRLAGDAAATPVMQASFLLMWGKQYDLAAAMATAGARVAPRIEREAERMGRLQSADRRRPDPNPGVEALRQLQLACATRDAFESRGRSLIDARVVENARDPGASEPDLYQAVCRAVVLSGSWPPAPTTVDYELTAELEVAGDAATGHRVQYRYPPAGATLAGRTFFFGVGSGSPRYLGQSAATAADEALRLAGSGRVQEAAAWLRWAREALGALPVGGTSSPTIEALATLWPGEPPVAQRMTAAAAAVMAYTPATQRRALAPLARALAASKDAAARRQLARALLAAQVGAGLAPEAGRTAAIVEGLGDAGAVATALRAKAAVLGGSCPKALALVRTRAGEGADVEMLRRVAPVAAYCGEYETAVEVLRRAVRAKGAEPTDENGLAWYLAFSGKASSEALAAARQAARRNGRRSRLILHTLALVAAQAGELAESRDALVEALRRPPPGVERLSEPSAWLVVGATAESLGMPAEAIAAYRRVTKESRPEHLRGSSWGLAQLRLAALERTTARP